MSNDKLLVFIALLFVAPIAAQAASATGPVWSISVVGLKGEPLGTIMLELTGENAGTCMSGEWKRARLIEGSFPSLATEFESKGYFPTYEARGHVLTIQLNRPDLCDAYLFLSGEFTERKGKGDYRTVGLGGGKSLGTFTAKRQ